MSEFKFACPVCGQHITADSSASGSQLDCPTCFRKIIVPQAPAGDSKLILSASEPSTGRPAGLRGQDLRPLRKSRPGLSMAGAALLLVVIGGGAAIYHYLPQIRSLIRQQPPADNWPTSGEESVGAPAVEDAGNSTGVRWTLDLGRAVIPDHRAGGSIHGHEFSGEHASLLGGVLFLRQGKGWPPELAVAIVLRARHAGDLRGKTIEVGPEQPPPVPQVFLRWKDDQQQAQKQELTNGYALKVVFGQVVDGRVSGKMFLALPDETKSVIAGTFDAEIRQTRTGK